MRALRIAIVTAALLLAGGAIYFWYSWRPCLGAMSACYQSWMAARNNVAPIDQRRASAIHGGFTASAAAVAFQAPISTEADSLIVIDRASKQARLIAAEGSTHWSPRFSDDGERLLFARRRTEQPENELVSCKVRDWRCTIVLRTKDSIQSPIDIGDGKILFVSSHTLYREGQPTRYPRFDLHIVTAGQPPIRLTHFDLLGMYAMSLGGDKLYFQAPGLAEMTRQEGCQSPIKCNSSEIFQLHFDKLSERVIPQPSKLRPAFIVDGLSVKPTISANATRIAFLNTSFEHFTYRYNLKVLNGNGTALANNPLDGKGVTLDMIPLNGIGFSNGAFAGQSLLVNELFGDRYRIREFNDDYKETDAIELFHSVAELRKLPRIDLVKVP